MMHLHPLKNFSKTYFIFLFVFSLLFSVLPRTSYASTIYLSPVGGSFTVGSTFDVSVLLDTKGKSINALQAFLSFPSDKLQVVSPSVGKSIIGVWTVAPKFNNNTGTLDLRGGIPGGIITSGGVLTNITFRVKSVGEAIIKVTDDSRVFLDDGLATDDLGETSGAVYQLRLPPPQGPIVVSSSHPDQSAWYQSGEATLSFANESSVEGYSYVISNDPITIPDNISEGVKQTVSYTGLSDGIHYFHVKSLRNGVWGGVTHFILQIDTTPPADFPVEILPSSRTSSVKPVVQFATTDAYSGLERYEIKLEPLSPEAIQADQDSTSSFFVETRSPFIPSPLVVGSYEVVIRAYDKANNFREVSKRFSITTPWFKIIGDTGIEIKNWKVIPWFWVIVFALILTILLFYVAHKVWRWRHELSRIHEEKKLPESVVGELAELKKYREKYGLKTLATFFAVISLASLVFFKEVQAQTIEIAPPLIDTLSRDISNKEIFYVGGKTNRSAQVVVLYFQNLNTGETTSNVVVSDNNGDWFYRHTGFLSSGDYLLWAQSKNGDVMSPPGPQEKMMVRHNAIQFGSNRLSYETIYFLLIILLILVILCLVSFIVYHFYHGRTKHKEFKREIREAEESIRRGFAILRRDIEAELIILRGANFTEALSIEEKEKEARLLHDLNIVQKKIGKEIWELKKESW